MSRIVLKQISQHRLTQPNQMGYIGLITLVGSGNKRMFSVSLIPKLFAKLIEKFQVNISKAAKSTNPKTQQANAQQLAQIRNFGVLKSPYGHCGPIPNETVVQHIYKEMDKWVEDPAAVSILISKFV